ncbi:EamA family transporter [Halarchaeum sp. P4]|uniref:DMT family transporter n=1 Tax=Halarchaeum sp. P4 TaxID=3421639 RepID=UPI003EBE2F45
MLDGLTPVEEMFNSTVPAKREPTSRRIFDLMSVELVGVGLAVFAAVALAVQSLTVRMSTKDQPVTGVITIMFVVNALVLVPVTLIRYYPDFGLTRVSIAAFAVAGVLGSFLARFALFVGIARLGASRAEPLKSTFPLVALVTAVLVLGEELTVPILVGVVLLVGGAVAVSWDARASPATPTGRNLVVDISFPLAAALLLGIDPVFVKQGLAEGTPALVGVTVRVLAAAAGFGLYLLWYRIRSGKHQLVRPTRWILLASVANTIYLVAYLAALARAPVSVIAPILGASPLFVLLGSAVFIQSEEKVTSRLVVSVLVLVAGVVLILSG